MLSRAHSLGVRNMKEQQAKIQSRDKRTNWGHNNWNLMWRKIWCLHFVKLD